MFVFAFAAVLAAGGCGGELLPSRIWHRDFELGFRRHGNASIHSFI